MTNRIRKLLTRALCAEPVGRVIARLFNDRIPFYGTTIDTAFGSITPATKAAIFFRFYEGGEIRFVHRYLPTGLDVIELGSSIGVMASQILLRQEPTVRLICVEANRELIDAVRANTRHASERVQVVEAALHYPESCESEVDFLTGNSTTDGRVVMRDMETCSVIRVPATSLSWILHEHKVEEYALVCDIEGAEAGMLKYDGQALSKCKFAVCELHRTQFEGREYSVDDLIARMTGELGFRLVDRYGQVCAFDRG